MSANRRRRLTLTCLTTVMLVFTSMFALFSCGSAEPESRVRAATARHIGYNPHAPVNASTPVRIEIPDAKVSAPVAPVGLNTDGTVQVPDIESAHIVAWFKHGHTPGEQGPSVMIGHVDNYYTGAVFYRIHKLKKHQIIEVRRKDGTATVFRVDKVAEYAKDAFPTDVVYGATEHPTLRLITCGGKYNPKRRSYTDNIVVFATMVEVL